jgi:phosphate transport system protein
VLTVMKIAANLERIGDYAKNMAKRTRSWPAAARSNGTAGARADGAEVRLMLKDVLDAYIQRDAELAEQVRQRDARSTRCTTRCSANS